jgi:hypothetical protein
MLPAEAKDKMPLSTQLPGTRATHHVIIEIGGLPIDVQTTDAEFERILKGRYGDYKAGSSIAIYASRAVVRPRNR